MTFEPAKEKHTYDGTETATGAGLDQGNGGVELVASRGSSEADGLEKQHNNGPPTSPFANTIEAHSELPQLQVGPAPGDAVSKSGKVEGETNSPAARMVSWQDMHGKDLYTVREFEPSEGGNETEPDHEWQERKGCCCIM